MTRRTALFVLAWPLACGCQDPAALWESRLSISRPLRVGETVMWVDQTRGRVFELDPAASPPAVGSVGVPRGAVLQAASADRGKLLVVTPGREALREGQAAEEPRLTVVEPRSVDQGGPRVASSYPLGAAFDRLALSADGRWAIAHFGDGSSTGGSLLRNPNELAVVRLDQPAGDGNPAHRTIRSIGSAPSGIAFSPPVDVGGASRTLAVILAEGYVTLLDLDHLDRGEATVPLRPSGSVQKVTPKQVLFDAAGPTILVRAEGAVDVFALTLEPRAPSEAAQNDFVPRVNQPSAGKTASDMLLFSDGEKRFLLTANTSQDLAVIDTATSEFSIVPLGAPVDTLVPVPAAAPAMAIAYSRGDPRALIHLVALPGLASSGEANVARRTLAAAAREVMILPGEGRALVVHDASRTALSVVDLGPRRSDAPILGQLALDSFDFTSRHLVAVSAGSPRLGVLDLDSLAAADVRLDHPPRRVIAVGERLVIDHQVDGGLVTVLPSPTAGRDAGRVLWGFLLAGLFDEELED